MGDTSTTPGQPSIGDLTNGMKQLTKTGGGKDLQLSPTACQNYLKLIGTFRQDLTDLRYEAETLTNYGGSPGGFESAIKTMQHLQLAVTAPDQGIVPNLDRYIAYLDELEKTVNAALTRFQAEDNS